MAKKGSEPMASEVSEVILSSLRNKSEKKRRTVRGSHLVVAYDWRHRGYIATKVYERLTISNFTTKFKSEFQFIVNKNVHRLPQGLRGVMAFINGQVSLVIRVSGDRTILKHLMNYNYLRSSYCEIPLKQIQDGYLLQQVAGERFGRIVNDRKNEPYPLLDMNGNIAMSPMGPDVVDLDDETLEFIRNYEDKNPIWGMVARPKVRPPDSIPVVYVLDDGQQRLDGNNHRMLRIPIGNPFGDSKRYYFHRFADVPHQLSQ